MSWWVAGSKCIICWASNCVQSFQGFAPRYLKRNFNIFLEIKATNSRLWVKLILQRCQQTFWFSIVTTLCISHGNCIIIALAHLAPSLCCCESVKSLQSSGMLSSGNFQDQHPTACLTFKAETFWLWLVELSGCVPNTFTINYDLIGWRGHQKSDVHLRDVRKMLFLRSFQRLHSESNLNI